MTLVKRHNAYGFPTIFEDFFKPDYLGGTEVLKTKVPAVNIKESDSDFIVELAAPGLKKEDFNIELDNNVLTISSELETESNEKSENGKYTRREFSFQSFKRSFTLPETVNENDIKANYENGVLSVHLPKKVEALPKAKRLIEIG
jgi:HSP20 family protein